MNQPDAVPSAGTASHPKKPQEQNRPAKDKGPLQPILFCRPAKQPACNVHRNHLVVRDSSTA